MLLFGNWMEPIRCILYIIRQWFSYFSPPTAFLKLHALDSRVSWVAQSSLVGCGAKWLVGIALNQILVLARWVVRQLSSSFYDVSCQVYLFHFSQHSAKRGPFCIIRSNYNGDLVVENRKVFYNQSMDHNKIYNKVIYICGRNTSTLESSPTKFHERPQLPMLLRILLELRHSQSIFRLLYCCSGLKFWWECHLG